MNYNKGIWKTGALAVVVTIAFAIFVFRAADWVKGFNSEFLVYGQTSGGGGTIAATGTSGLVTKVIPQIAVGDFGDGTKYTTVIQIINTSSTGITVSGNFYTQLGAASPVSLRTSTGATISGGVLSATALNGNSVLVLTSQPAAGAAPIIAWGKIVATGAVSIATFFEIRDGINPNILYSRVGVQASPANMASFIIPRTRNVSTGLDIAFALVNTGTAATLNATLRDASGATISTKSLPLTAGQQTALFTQQFFGLTSEPTGTNYHFIVFDGGTAAQFAAIALAYEGATQTSFPVDQLR